MKKAISSINSAIKNQLNSMSTKIFTHNATNLRVLVSDKLGRLKALLCLCLMLIAFPAFPNAPVPAPAPTQITFTILNTCSSVDTYNFFLNGTSIGSVGSNPSGGCTCTAALQTFTVNNAALLAGAWN